MFFTQQELELLNSWPKSAVWSKSFHIEKPAQIFLSSTVKKQEKQDLNSKSRCEKSEQESFLVFCVKVANW